MELHDSMNDTSLETFLQSCWRLRFPAELERAYREDHASRSLPFIRACLILSAGIYAAFALLIPRLNPGNPFSLYVLNLGIMCPVLALFYVTTYFQFYLKLGQSIVFVQALTIALGVLAIIGITNPKDPGYAINYVGLILTVQSAFILGRLRVSYTTLLSLLVLLGYAFVCLVIQSRHHSPDTLTPFLNNILYLISADLISIAGAYLLEVYLRRDFIQQLTIEAEKRKVEAERQKSERLLHNILPAQIAERLKRSSQVIADVHGNATVLFLDIVNFTPLTDRMQPAEVVNLLNAIFGRLDTLVATYGIEKIKTVGDAYMVAAGVPTARDDHAGVIGCFALDALEVIHGFTGSDGKRLQARIGIDTGSAVAGVIGHHKFLYDLWGDMVNTASRMESHSIPDRIQTSRRYYDQTQGMFIFESRGVIDIKGKGQMETFFLVARCDRSRPQAGILPHGQLRSNGL
jgi:adenylate cyclase